MTDPLARQVVDARAPHSSAGECSAPGRGGEVKRPTWSDTTGGEIPRSGQDAICSMRSSSLTTQDVRTMYASGSRFHRRAAARLRLAVRAQGKFFDVHLLGAIGRRTRRSTVRGRPRAVIARRVRLTSSGDPPEPRTVHVRPRAAQITSISSHGRAATCSAFSEIGHLRRA